MFILGLLLLLSCFSHVRLCVTPETAAHQAPLSLGFSRQEHWSGLPFPLASLVAQTVKHLPAVWETQLQSLGWEDPLQKEMATHFSTLAWKILWTEEPGQLQPMGSQRVGRD